jgi:hypothetical protein
VLRRNDRDYPRRHFYSAETAVRILSGLIFFTSTLSILRGGIPWPEVTRKLADENAKLARRPGGHNGEYFVVCTLYFTPKESGFIAERGFDVTLVTRPGLHGRKYPRDFLRAVKKEGFGRLTNPAARIYRPARSWRRRATR